jgi:hypothetical protein
MTNRKIIRYFGWKPVEKLRHSCDDNIKTEVREIDTEYVDGIEVAQDIIQLWIPNSWAYID